MIVLSLVSNVAEDNFTHFINPMNTFKPSRVEIKHEKHERPKLVEVTSRGREIRVTATAYTAGIESTGKSPSHPQYGITASGKRAREYHTIAVDTHFIPLGSEVYIKEFNRTYIAEDTGGAIKGNRVDIYMESLQRAKEFGRKEITIYVRKK